MEMDSGQYWQDIKESLKNNDIGLRCFKCGKEFSKKEIKNRWGNMFKACNDCKGEVGFYRKK